MRVWDGLQSSTRSVDLVVYRRGAFGGPMSIAAPMLALAAISGAGAAPWPDLSQSAVTGSLEGKNDAAVLVAVEDYARLEDIQGARASIDHWTRWLARTRGVPVTRIHRLIDQQASPEQLRSAVTSAAGQVGEEGTLWFVFVGHVAPGPGGLDHVFIGADAEPTVQSIHAESVSRAALWERSGGARSVWVVDASLRGMGSDGAPLVIGLPEARPEVPPLLGQLFLGWAEARASPEASLSLPTPALSYLTLGALRGWADQDGDTVVHSKELNEYLASALWASGVEHPVCVVGEAAALVGGAAEAGPDLVDRMVDPLRSGNLGGAVIEAALEPRLEERARWAAAAEAAEATMNEQVGAERRRALQSRAARLASAEKALQKRAAADWAAIRVARESGGDRSYAVVRGFVDTYEQARVRVETASRWVLVPEVELALDWLRERDRARARDPLTTPDLPADVEPAVRDAVMADFGDCLSLARPDGCADLGVRFERGTDGLVASPEKAVSLYRRGCDQRSGDACNNLGVAYGRGVGLAADPVLARRWLEVACTLDAGRGCGNLAMLLTAGEGGDRNLSRSLQVLTRGCTLDDGASCAMLGARLADGTHGAERDLEQARRLIAKACRLGHATACDGADTPP